MDQEKIKMKSTIIYNRVSTEDQNPENQIKDCLKLVKRLNLFDYDILQEKKSGFKSHVEREKFNLIKDVIKKRKVDHLIVWDLDRLFRNRKKLVQFFEYCKLYNCKIHSHNQEWLEQLHNIPDPFNEIMHTLMLNLMGWLAEDESKKKSARVKASIRVKDGKVLSYKGNKWGRPEISKRVIEDVIKLKDQGLTIRQISNQVYYWDKARNKKQLSKSAVHKILTKIKEETS